MARTCVSDNAVATASASTSEILALGAQWPNLQTRNVQPIQQREIESPSKTISHLGPRLANLNRLPLHWQQQHLATGRPLQMLLLLSNKLNSSVKTWDRKKHGCY